MIKKEPRNIAKTSMIVFCWLVVWEIADRVVDNRIILSGPVHIVQALIEQLRQPDFLMICAASFLRITVGFLLSFVVGFFLAVLCYRFKLLRDILDPVMVMLKTVPMISFVIMLLIWVGNQMLTVYLSFLIVFPMIYTSTLAGFLHVNQDMLEMSETFHLSRWKKFLYIYRPSFMPFLLSSCKVALGMSWKSGIMAEVIGTPRPSIGREMNAARTYLQTADLFAWTIVVIVLSVVFEKMFMAILQRMNGSGGSLLAEQDEGGSKNGTED